MVNMKGRVYTNGQYLLAYLRIVIFVTSFLLLTSACRCHSGSVWIRMASSQHQHSRRTARETHTQRINRIAILSTNILNIAKQQNKQQILFQRTFLCTPIVRRVNSISKIILFFPLIFHIFSSIFFSSLFCFWTGDFFCLLFSIILNSFPVCVWILVSVFPTRNEK